jgi:hypothetical protein
MSANGNGTSNGNGGPPPRLAGGEQAGKPGEGIGVEGSNSVQTGLIADTSDRVDA